ncbi:hypothetical protein [Neisseria shayeganii]|uniref:Helix-turn-helix domain-containing protein n=1 Tax=Neisseria shayeganii TaxID=607712 RepID=A0A7D7RW67_9NEIS|nr:hypothetical protein [Neisseria shayeganii]QMT41384.1 hypothetical protein H3L94_04995 [Neisseria shayeganii]
MASRRDKIKAWNEASIKRNGKNFVTMRFDVLKSPQFTGLSGNAVKLLMYFCSQYNGFNNGDMSAPKNRAADVGMSPMTLEKAKQELLDKGFIIVTRQGGRNLCSLYALTFFAIDECGGKLDVPPTRRAPDYWEQVDRDLIGSPP